MQTVNSHGASDKLPVKAASHRLLSRLNACLNAADAALDAHVLVEIYEAATTEAGSRWAEDLEACCIDLWRPGSKRRIGASSPEPDHTALVKPRDACELSSLPSCSIAK